MIVLQIGNAINSMVGNVEKDIQTLTMILFSVAGAYSLWNLYKIYEAYNRGEDGIQQKLVRWFISMVFYGFIVVATLQAIL